MTVIEKCELIWKGKNKIKGNLTEKPHPLKVVRSINTSKSKSAWSNKLILGDNKFALEILQRKFKNYIRRTRST